MNIYNYVLIIKLFLLNWVFLDIYVCCLVGNHYSCIFHYLGLAQTKHLHRHFTYIENTLVLKKGSVYITIDWNWIGLQSNMPTTNNQTQTENNNLTGNTGSTNMARVCMTYALYDPWANNGRAQKATPPCQYSHDLLQVIDSFVFFTTLLVENL